MFGKLKEKLGGWFKKKPIEEEIKKKPKKKVVNKEKKISKDLKKEKKISKDKDVSSLKPQIVSEIKDKLTEKSDFKENDIPVLREVEKQPVSDETKKITEKTDKKTGFFKRALGKRNEDSKGEINEPEIKEVKKKEIEVKVKGTGDLGFFGKIKKRLTTNELTQEQFDEAYEELQYILLENNVALGVVDAIHDSLSKDLVNVVIKKDDIENNILTSLKDSILDILVDGENLFETIEKTSECPYVILFFGINGAGKTTSIAKVAFALKKMGVTCVLGAGDTFRAASIEQLETHANKIGVPIVKSDYGKDSASVGFDTIAYAKKNKIKVVLLDSAGRMYTSGNLMREMEKIVKVTKPNMKIFVGESITGNDATEQAKAFNENFGIDGIILSKADIDEKAGTILSVSYVTGKPILFLGVGQNYSDLEVFTKERVMKGLGLD